MSASSGLPFEAWALPPGMEPPAGAPTERAEGGVAMRLLSADATWLRQAAASLRASGTRLRAMPVREVAALLGRAGSRFLAERDPLRARALELLPATSGLSPAMAAAVLDGMAADWSAERLLGLLRSEFADPGALDGFVDRFVDGVGDPAHGRVRAAGPRLCAQIVSGSVPGVGATALLRALLVKAPTLVKPGWGDVVLPVLMARAVAEEEPTLAEAAAVVYWPGGSDALEAAAATEADVVVAYGGDDAVGALRARTAVTTRFVAYHHRVSAGVVGRDALTSRARGAAASAVAGAVAFFDQRGCVSPQVVFVERGGPITPEEFAGEVAAALSAVEGTLPAGRLDAPEAAALQQARGAAEVVAASGSGASVRHGGNATWTVIYDPADTLATACVGRLIRIVPVDDAEDAARRLAGVGAHLQTVGTAGLAGDRLERLADALASVGASRIAPFEDVPFPPPWWNHDGQGPLRALVRWIDLEGR